MPRSARPPSDHERPGNHMLPRDAKYICSSAPMTRAAFQTALKDPLEATDFPQLGSYYRGKVRDNYSGKDGVRTIIVTDRTAGIAVDAAALRA